MIWLLIKAYLLLIVLAIIWAAGTLALICAGIEAKKRLVYYLGLDIYPITRNRKDKDHDGDQTILV